MKKIYLILLIVMVLVVGNIAVYYVIKRPLVTSSYKEKTVKDSLWSSCVDQGGFYKIMGNEPLKEDTVKETVVMNEAAYNDLKERREKAQQEEHEEIEKQKKYIPISPYDDTTAWIGFGPKYGELLICYRVGKGEIIVKDSSAAAIRYMAEGLARNRIMIDSLIRHQYYMEKYFH